MSNKMEVDQVHTVAKDLVWVQMNGRYTIDQVKGLRYAFEHLHLRTGIHFVITEKDVELKSLSDDALRQLGLKKISVVEYDPCEEGVI